MKYVFWVRPQPVMKYVIIGIYYTPNTLSGVPQELI